MLPQKSPSLPPKSSPVIPWGSPALRPNASFPPGNRAPHSNTTPPHRPPASMAVPSGTRPFGPGFGSGSPQFGNPFASSFRTPQHHHRSPNTQERSWSDNRGNRQKPRFSGNPNGSPRDSPNMNPGGSDDITQYYNSDMVNDPWLNTPPKPVDFWKTQS